MDSYTIFSNKMDELKTQFDDSYKIKTLDLSKCKLTLLPKEIGDFQNLEYLDISKNFLNELPKEIGNLKKLKELKVDSCFGGLANLVVYENRDKYGNNISLLPDEIGELTELKYLMLQRINLHELNKPDNITLYDYIQTLDLGEGFDKLLLNYMFSIDIIDIVSTSADFDFKDAFFT